MAGSNQLVIGVAADTSKARADIVLLTAELSSMGKALAQAGKDGDQAKVLELAGPYEDLRNKLAGAKDEIKQSGTHAAVLKAEVAAGAIEARVFGQRLKEAAEHIEGVRGKLSGGLEGLFGNIPLGGKGLAIGLGLGVIGEAIHLISEQAERAHEIEAMSTALGVSTGQIYAWQQAARAASVDGGILDKALERLATAAEKSGEAQKKAIVASAESLDQGTVQRGKEGKNPSLNKSTAEPHVAQFLNAPKLDDPKFRDFVEQRFKKMTEERDLELSAGQFPRPVPSFDMLSTQIRNLMTDVVSEAGKQMRQDFAKFAGIGNSPIANPKEGYERLDPKFQDSFEKMGVQLLDGTGKLREFGDIAAETTVGLRHLDDAARLLASRELFSRGGLDPKFQKFMVDQGKLGGGVFKTPASDDLNVKALAEVQDKRKRAEAAVADAAFTGAGATVRGVDAAIDGVAEALKHPIEFAEKLDQALEKLADPEPFNKADQHIDRMAAEISNVANEAWGAAKALGAMGAAVSSTVSGAKSGIASAAAAAADANTALPGMAGGGMIYGPGTGTSDSIPLWGSAGEFMVNAKATAHHLPLLHAINSGAHGFALGGMIGGPAIPSFAGGGLVGGGSSYGTVNLTLPGGSASLQVNNRGGFDDLVSAARTDQRTSAGAKPSWYQGR